MKREVCGLVVVVVCVGDGCEQMGSAVDGDGGGGGGGGGGDVMVCAYVSGFGPSV